jgi:hypothetical protein
LTETYPLHVVCAWLGNSPEVARKHYLQTLDSHFEQAAGTTAEEKVQNPAHDPDGQTPMEGELVGVGATKSPENPGCRHGSAPVGTDLIPPRGVEPC